MQRRNILRSIGVLGSSLAVPGVATGQPDRARGRPERYETVAANHPIRRIGTQIAFHDSHERAAFVSAVFSEGIELYVAEDVQEPGDVPSNIYRITSDSMIGSFKPSWEKPNEISFAHDLRRERIRVPRSYIRHPAQVTVRTDIDINRTVENAEFADRFDEPRMRKKLRDRLGRLRSGSGNGRGSGRENGSSKKNKSRRDR